MMLLQEQTSTSTILLSLEPYLWPDRESLHVMAILLNKGSQATVNIFEI